MTVGCVPPTGDVPFDPPQEPLAEAVSEQLDFKARLDTLGRKLDLQSERSVVVTERLATVARDVSQLRIDIGRAVDVGTANALMLERIERHLVEMRSEIKRGRS